MAVPRIALRGADGWGGLPTEGASSPGCSGLQHFSRVTCPCFPQHRGRGWGVGHCWCRARSGLQHLPSHRKEAGGLLAPLLPGASRRPHPVQATEDPVGVGAQRGGREVSRAVIPGESGPCSVGERDLFRVDHRPPWSPAGPGKRGVGSEAKAAAAGV